MKRQSLAGVARAAARAAECVRTRRSFQPNPERSLPTYTGQSRKNSSIKGAFEAQPGCTSGKPKICVAGLDLTVDLIGQHPTSAGVAVRIGLGRFLSNCGGFVDEEFSAGDKWNLYASTGTFPPAGPQGLGFGAYGPFSCQPCGVPPPAHSPLLKQHNLPGSRPAARGYSNPPWPSQFLPSSDLSLNGESRAGEAAGLADRNGFWKNKHRTWGDEEWAKPLQLAPGSLVEAGTVQGRSEQSPNGGSPHLDRQWGQEEEEGGGLRTPVTMTPAASAKAREYYIPVKAYFIARSLDLRSFVEGVYKGRPQPSARNHVIIRWPDRDHRPDDEPGRGGGGSNGGGVGSYAVSHKPGMEGVPAHHERFVVAFQYGSVVLFNFSGDEQDEALHLVSRYATDAFIEARKQDDYGVVLRPSLTGWSEGGHDHIMVKRLDTNNIRVISSILGQSVALDHYAKKVDEMVTTFSELNRGMEQTGTFTMKRKKLFQLVAAANTTLADVILRLGLLERSDTAWKHAHYAKIWEYLRDDFELDERFENLDFKLNIIQHNVRFFLDILQNRKSDTLEWIIILLIAGEICLGLYEIVTTAMNTTAAAAAAKAAAAAAVPPPAGPELSLDH